MRRLKLITLSGFILAGTMQSVAADPESCREAVDGYNSARREVSDALRSYASSVSGSQGHDDCSSEFSQLSSAQDDFESAVSEYESECS
jgi:hypothetical protein